MRVTFAVPECWRGQRIVLNFGAVNWEATVTVNGKWVGHHTGGDDGFSFDITNALTPSGPQELVVSVHHPIGGAARQTRGAHRLYHVYRRRGHLADGLAGTGAHRAYRSFQIDFGYRPRTVASGGGDHSLAATGQTVEAIVMDGEKEVARASGFPGLPLCIAIPNAKLWWPETPFLYDLKITLKQDDKVVDAVGSYFGMRKISVGPDQKGITRSAANNQYIFQNWLFWTRAIRPDCIYTAPSDEELTFRRRV